jgi:hypothetical protein
VLEKDNQNDGDVQLVFPTLQAAAYCRAGRIERKSPPISCHSRFDARINQLIETPTLHSVRGEKGQKGVSG